MILLLFEVGLESNFGEMRRVGASSLLVAVLGVAAPMGLGWAASRWLLPDHSWHVHLFIGATLCATSVGITARVLKDLGKADTPEAKIILGAAVIDDVLGLIVLAVVQAIIVQGSPSPLAVLWLVGKAFGFLVGAVVLGEWLSPRLFAIAAKLRVHGMLVITSLVFCFGVSWLAAAAGLAPIVGAFAAGLILDERHYAPLRASDERSLEDWVLPLTTLLVPIFFVMMGVGIGMIPRGEVGLIFAAIGQSLISEGRPVIDGGVYTAIVVMVMVTTLVTPPLLGWSLQPENRNRMT